jgi:hypothetical protein
VIQSIDRDGLRVTRFRVGSEAVLTGARVQERQGLSIVTAEFSERVTGDMSALALLGTNGKPMDCQVRGAVGEEPTDAVDKGLSPRGVDTIELVCKGKVDPSRPLRFDLQPGIRSMSGLSKDARRRRLVMNAAEWALPHGEKVWKTMSF